MHYSLDSPLVQHRLTVQRSARQLSLFGPYICVDKHWWRFRVQNHDQLCKPFGHFGSADILMSSFSLKPTSTLIFTFLSSVHKNYIYIIDHLRLHSLAWKPVQVWKIDDYFCASSEINPPRHNPSLTTVWESFFFFIKFARNCKGFFPTGFKLVFSPWRHLDFRSETLHGVIP